MSTVKSVPKSDFLSFVRKYLVVEGLPCARGHCEQRARFMPLVEERNRLVGAYLCPDYYVSRIVSFASANNHDMGWFQSFVKSELEGGELARDKDFRVATRHGWELGKDAEMEILQLSDHSKEIKEYYWTSYPKGEGEKKMGNFLCERCGKLFSQSLTSKSRTCQRH
jgi:hypothetical protein